MSDGMREQKKPKGRQRREQKDKRLGNLGSTPQGGWHQLPHERILSAAYCRLSHSGRTVLIDMDRVYMVKSRFDTVDISDVGFRYTYADCGVTVCQRVFYDVLDQIVALGFYGRVLDDAGPVMGPHRYRPDVKWKDVEPDERYREFLRKKELRLKSDLRRKSKAKREAVDKIATDEKVVRGAKSTNKKEVQEP